MVERKLAEGVCQVVLEKAYEVDKRWTSFSVVLPAEGHHVIPELEKKKTISFTVGVNTIYINPYLQSQQSDCGLRGAS